MIDKLINAMFGLFCVVLALFLAFLYVVYKYAVGEDPAAEYRALCVKNEGKPVYNGRHWECVK